MTPITNSRMLVSTLFGLTATIVLIPNFGCQHLANPWQDELQGAAAVTTASEESVRSQTGSPSNHSRGFAAAETQPANGEVTHWPLWWENPFVDRGSQDEQVAITAEDYVAMPYGWGRHLVNLFGFPISVVVQPPWTVMTSDGVTSRQALGYDHDATEYPQVASN